MTAPQTSTRSKDEATLYNTGTARPLEYQYGELLLLQVATYSIILVSSSSAYSLYAEAAGENIRTPREALQTFFTLLGFSTSNLIDFYATISSVAIGVIGLSFLVDRHKEHNDRTLDSLARQTYKHLQGSNPTSNETETDLSRTLASITKLYPNLEQTTFTAGVFLTNFAAATMTISATWTCMRGGCKQVVDGTEISSRIAEISLIWLYLIIFILVTTGVLTTAAHERYGSHIRLAYRVNLLRQIHDLSRGGQRNRYCDQSKRDHENIWTRLKIKIPAPLLFDEEDFEKWLVSLEPRKLHLRTYLKPMIPTLATNTIMAFTYAKTGDLASILFPVAISALSLFGFDQNLKKQYRDRLRKIRYITSGTDKRDWIDTIVAPWLLGVALTTLHIYLWATLGDRGITGLYAKILTLVLVVSLISSLILGFIHIPLPPNQTILEAAKESNAHAIRAALYFLSEDELRKALEKAGTLLMKPPCPSTKPKGSAAKPGKSRKSTPNGDPLKKGTADRPKPK